MARSGTLYNAPLDCELALGVNDEERPAAAKVSESSLLEECEEFVDRSERANDARLELGAGRDRRGLCDMWQTKKTNDQTKNGAILERFTNAMTSVETRSQKNILRSRHVRSFLGAFMHFQKKAWLKICAELLKTPWCLDLEATITCSKLRFAKALSAHTQNEKKRTA